MIETSSLIIKQGLDSASAGTRNANAELQNAKTGFGISDIVHCIQKILKPDPTVSLLIVAMKEVLYY